MNNFNNYDVFNLGISGGKDSTAVFLWTLFESNIPRERLRVTFCDTGNEDPFTYRFIEMLSELHPITYLKPELDFWELAHAKKRFPSRKGRFLRNS